MVRGEPSLDDVVLQSIVLLGPLWVPSSVFSWQQSFEGHSRFLAFKPIVNTKIRHWNGAVRKIYMSQAKRWFARGEMCEPGSWHSLSSSFLATSIFCACANAAGRVLETAGLQCASSLEQQQHLVACNLDGLSASLLVLQAFLTSRRRSTAKRTTKHLHWADRSFEATLMRFRLSKRDLPSEPKANMSPLPHRRANAHTFSQNGLGAERRATTLLHATASTVTSTSGKNSSV